MAEDRRNIFLFDGECGACSRAVHFIMDRDPTAQISFASLQSEIGRNLCIKHQIEINSTTGIPDSMVFIKNGTTYLKSDAALQIMYLFGSFWILLYYIGILVPLFVRNFIYDTFSENRYRASALLGEDSCRMPTDDFKRRLLDSQNKHKSG
jgi:predicted DCC family thiol-disulfide oxidoreductase YuxK